MIALQLLLLFHATLYRRTRSARPITPHHEARTGLYSAARPLRMSPRHSSNGSVTRCRDPRTQRPRVASRAGLSREQRQPLESPGNGATTWNGPHVDAWKIENIEFSRLYTATNPDLDSPRMPLTPLGPSRAKAAPLPPTLQKSKRRNNGGAAGRGEARTGNVVADAGPPDPGPACGRLQPLRQA